MHCPIFNWFHIPIFHFTPARTKKISLESIKGVVLMIFDILENFANQGFEDIIQISQLVDLAFSLHEKCVKIFL